ncbi:unnamed protein product [Rhizophagus irregularis]|nr:unnamed protein product [Rhizophagus irregularis]
MEDIEDALYNFCIKYPNDKIYVNEEVFTDFRVFDIRELRKAIFKSQHYYLDSQINEYEVESLKKDHLELWLLNSFWNFIDRGCWDGREKNKELTVYTLGLDSPAGYLCNYVE